MILKIRGVDSDPSFTRMAHPEREVATHECTPAPHNFFHVLLASFTFYVDKASKGEKSVTMRRLRKLTNHSLVLQL